MQPREPIHQAIAEIVKTMPPEVQREVADYVEFLRQRYRTLKEGGPRSYGEWTDEELRQLSLEALKRAWGPEDSVYDDL